MNGVGLMHYYLQRQHLKYNLYDKRFRVFSAIQKVLCAPKATSTAAPLLHDLERESAEVSFLFGPEFKSLVAEIDTVLRELRWDEHTTERSDRTRESTAF